MTVIKTNRFVELHIACMPKSHADFPLIKIVAGPRKQFSKTVVDAGDVEFHLALEGLTRIAYQHFPAVEESDYSESMNS